MAGSLRKGNHPSGPFLSETVDWIFCWISPATTVGTFKQDLLGYPKIQKIFWGQLATNFGLYPHWELRNIDDPAN